MPVIRLDDRDRAADLDMARAVSLTFAEPLPIRDVLLMLFRGTPLSVVFDPTVNGTFVGELANLSLRQALEAVLFPANLDYDIKGAVVRVFPRHPEMRLFEVNYLDVRRAWQRRATSVATPDAASSAADLSIAAESDFFTDLERGVRALLSESGRAHVDRNAGLVQVTDFVDRVERVGLYIEAVTLRATRQVRLTARVLEVTLTDSAIDWSAIAARTGLQPGAEAGIKVEDFNALLRAIGTFGDVRIIAAPQVLAMNNEPAMMRISLTDGLTLTIIPQISSDGIVHMSVSPTLTGVSQGPSAARFVIEADTTMRVRSGYTAVIAGLWRESRHDDRNNAAPTRSGTTRGSQARTELVILITPTVVNAGVSPVAGAQ